MKPDDGCQSPPSKRGTAAGRLPALQAGLMPDAYCLMPITMPQRLQKLISAAGLCSRRRAEEWILEGKVTLNGVLAHLGDTADPDRDQILVAGKPLPAPPERTTTVLLYKPRGYVTTLSDEKDRPTVARLLPPELGRLYPVGRLDQFSEGLLLMTNDGALANRLTHPRGEVRKTYRLWVSGWHDGAEEQLRCPITLDGYRIKPPAVRLLWARETGTAASHSHVGAVIGRPPEAVSHSHVGAVIGRPPEAAEPAALREERSQTTRIPSGEATALLEITIHEGRNRQIRRMARAAGLTPTRLKRIAEGPLTLGDLKPGQWRELTEAELRQLTTEN